MSHRRYKTHCDLRTKSRCHSPNYSYICKRPGSSVWDLCKGPGSCIWWLVWRLSLSGSICVVEGPNTWEATGGHGPGDVRVGWRMRIEGLVA